VRPRATDLLGSTTHTTASNSTTTASASSTASAAANTVTADSYAADDATKSRLAVLDESHSDSSARSSRSSRSSASSSSSSNDDNETVESETPESITAAQERLVAAAQQEAQYAAHVAQLEADAQVTCHIDQRLRNG
jgi:hypothetical protein